MKKPKLISIILASLLLFAGCSSNASGKPTANSAVALPVYPQTIAFDDYEAKNTVLTENDPDEEFIRALTRFAVSSTGTLLSSTRENQMYSPISLYYPLALCAVGAGGETKSQLLEALQMAGFDDDYIADQSARLFRCLYTDNEVFRLNLANSLWMAQYSFKENFLNTAAKEFYAALYEVDFSQDSTAKEMAKWVSEHTGGLINPEYNFSEDLVLMILNTVYFKDAWSKPFEKQLTEADEFTLSDGSVVTADFMNMTSNRNYIDGDGWSLLPLRTVGGATMNFVLPDEGIAPEDLMAPEKLTAILGAEGESVFAQVTASIPKFDFGVENGLKELLLALGATHALDPELADFSNMADDGMFISSARQLARISIDEEGVEAAAYTEISMDATSALVDEPQPVELIFDRPFLFFIEYQGVILFTGIVQNPTAG
ncbi:MAG: serpin family protein [Oscillospiraceae bacterium]|jgi:serine protease inhibitor